MAIDVNSASLAGPRIERLRDGTVRQYHPFTGVTVLSVPARGRRPRPVDEGTAPERRAVYDEHGREATCNFCEACHQRVTPEKSRVEAASEANGGFRTIDHESPTRALENPAAFRRIANLFEIVSYAFWVDEYGFEPSDKAIDHQARYLADPRGEAHLRTILEYAEGESAWSAASRSAIEKASLRFFAGSHDLVVARRHFAPASDGGDERSELASSGHLSPDEHFAYVRCALDTAAAIEAANPHARSVHVFQNWLRDAGASFDHLHKQILALDTIGRPIERKLAILRDRPDALRVWGIEFARREALVVAERPSAVAYVDIGHRFPTLTIQSLAESSRPGELSTAELRDVSDLLHFVHRALGPSMPVNEEWQVTPRDSEVVMPLHVHVRCRDHRIAGLEGSSGVHVSPHTPTALRDRIRDSARL